MTVLQKRYKVLVLGDFCYDATWLCTERPNPETNAPCITILKSEPFSFGMAGNVMHGLEKLGFDTYYYFSDAIKTSIKNRYIDIKTRRQLARIDHDYESFPASTDLIIERLDNLYPDAIVISDYCKGFITEEAIECVIDNSDCPIFVDTKKKDLQLFNHPRIVLKINTPEFLQAVNVPNGTIITRGAYGAQLYSPSKCLVHYEAYTPSSEGVVDVCGAGDAFLAGLVYGYVVAGKYPYMHYALVNAGISVTKHGTYAPTLDELLAGVEEYNAISG